MVILSDANTVFIDEILEAQDLQASAHGLLSQVMGHTQLSGSLVTACSHAFVSCRLVNMDHLPYMTHKKVRQP